MNARLKARSPSAAFLLAMSVLIGAVALVLLWAFFMLAFVVIPCAFWGAPGAACYDYAIVWIAAWAALGLVDAILFWGIARAWWKWFKGRHAAA